MSEILIIPSSKLIPEELRFEFGSIPPCLLPFNNDIAINQIIHDNHRKKAYIYLAINEGNEKIIEYFRYIKPEFKFVNVGKTNSLGETILITLEKALKDYPSSNRLTIQFADTIIPELSLHMENESTVLYSKTNQLYRWTSFEVQNGSLVITDKKSQHKLYSNVFVGQFSFSDLGVFYNSLKSLFLIERKPENVQIIDPFYEAIILYYNECGLEFKEVSNWFDIGHIDNYYRSKKLFVNTRFFNSLSYIEQNNTIIKKTSNESKLIDEINWYLNLPGNLQFLTPRIFGYSLEKNNVYCEMEYYGYSNLGELFLYSDIDISIWDEIIKRIFNLIDLFRTYKNGTLKKDQISQIYKSKTIDRINLLVSLPEFGAFWKDSIIINGRERKGLRLIVSGIDDLLLKSGLFSDRMQTIIHGDFCLSNLLYDIRHGIFKLIDPRGSFGEKGIYGDYLYDIAKMTHSFLGGYEFIINNRFAYSFEKGEHKYQIFYSRHQKHIQELFLKNITKYLSDKELSMVYLIQGLLYLSMVPLHKDDPKKQKIMLAQGLLMINDIINK